MKETTVEKVSLQAILRANRDKHRQVFLSALEGYRAQVIGLLENHIARIRRGDLTEVYVHIPVPQDHTDDYDRAIAMLDWEIRPEVSLTAGDFAQLVQDDWGWKRQWIETASTYAAASVTAHYGDEK